MDFLDLLTKAGPYVAALLEAFAIRWLLVQLKEKSAAYDDQRKRIEQLLEQRTTDQVAATQAMATGAQMVTDALREHDRRIDRFLATGVP